MLFLFMLASAIVVRNYIMALVLATHDLEAYTSGSDNVYASPSPRIRIVCRFITGSHWQWRVTFRHPTARVRCWDGDEGCRSYFNAGRRANGPRRDTFGI